MKKIHNAVSFSIDNNSSQKETSTINTVHLASNGCRGLAFVLDFLAAFLLVGIFEEIDLAVVGLFLAVAYFITKEWIFRGKSLGKLIFMIQVVKKPDFKPISLRDSIYRQLPLLCSLIFFSSLSGLLILMLIFLQVPDTVANTFAPAAFFGIFLSVFVIYPGAFGKHSNSWGDQWANTVALKRLWWLKKNATYVIEAPSQE